MDATINDRMPGSSGQELQIPLDEGLLAPAGQETSIVNMTKSALSQLSSIDFLSDTWHEMYSSTPLAKRQSSGIDNISLDDFELCKKHYIKKLAFELKSGTYEAQLLSPHFIPKTNGKDRVICVPTVRDRLLQKALGKIIHQRGYDQTNRISYGFVKNRSVKKALNKAIEYRKNYPWAYKADISAFFDSIDRDLLAEKIKCKIRLRSLHPILLKIVKTEIHTNSNSEARRIKTMGIKKGTGLRQGMPISPYLANLMLRDFDTALINKNVKAVRYADDLITFSNSHSLAKETHILCYDLLAKEGLSIHPLEKGTKTVIAAPEEPIEFLGLALTPTKGEYQLKITDQQLTAIQSKIIQLGDINTCLKHGITLSKLVQKIEGKITGFKGAYDLCQNIQQLEHSLESSKNKALKKVLADLGINYSELTTKQQRFLEIDSKIF
ncbi:reverse transcriptase domain-containing protein [Neptuniibacter sp. QD37_11]|uniref:reverse transcriptase domain-containing protein n=1 Tax=Neptuniibacter sp. QD37_11 TaxID=3398209 RepID=UPI0039F529E0